VLMILHYTADQVLKVGLKLLGVSTARQNRQKHKTNVQDFRDHYGTEPDICAKIWDDLQTTNIPDAKIQATLYPGRDLKNFLRACHFLRRYKTEAERKVDSGNTKKTVRKWTWFFLHKIGALRAEKIVWPTTWASNFIISVDGVHCNYHEEKHATLSKDPSLYSHKRNGPGLVYELAMSLFEPKLVWVKGLLALLPLTLLSIKATFDNVFQRARKQSATAVTETTMTQNCRNPIQWILIHCALSKRVLACAKKHSTDD